MHGKALESLANSDEFFWRYLAMWWCMFSSENTLGWSWNLGSTKYVTNTLLYEERVSMWRSIQKRDMQDLLSWQSVMTNLKRSVNTSKLFSRWYLRSMTVIQGARLKLSEQDFLTDVISSHRACKFPCFFQGPFVNASSGNLTSAEIQSNNFLRRLLMKN